MRSLHPRFRFNPYLECILRNASMLRILSLLLFASILNAHPGNDGASPVALRHWSINGGNLIARFVAERDGSVLLRENHGPETRVKLAEIDERDRAWIAERLAAIREVNHVHLDTPAPAIAKSFEPFKLKTRWDADWLYVESNCLPNHPMMKGITNWQQQVPLPQDFTGRNAWQIPLKPTLAEKPLSAKTNFFHGAIALAVNGVPIFNALNNRGEDAFKIGELDEWGGHCGRADDYHYHAAPLHLEKLAGKGNPIAYALDGFALYGLADADVKLDEFNGTIGKDGVYRYHATKTYPYVNGGLRGKLVEVRGDQIEPQPRMRPWRPAGEPLRGAKITDFESKGDDYTLKYEVRGSARLIRYHLGKDDVKFQFEDEKGTVREETHRKGEEKKGPKKK